MKQKRLDVFRGAKGFLRTPRFSFLLYFLFSAFCPLPHLPCSLTSLYAQSQTELGSEGDLTVLGTEGTALDPNTEIKGFTVFGSTQASYPGASAGNGNVVVNGVLAVSSGAYFVGNSTFTGANKIFINDGTAGQVLRKGAAGALSWDDAAAVGDNLGNHTATTQLKMGSYAIWSSSDITAAHYQIGGQNMVAVLPGTNSIAYGVYAGTSNITGGNNNVFVGNYAGTANTTGGQNSFLGHQTGYSNTTGSSNSFLGTYAGYYNTTGARNSFIGYRAGTFNTTGNNHTFFGNDAGYRNTTGTDNSFLGTYAGHYNQTGSGDTVVGYGAGGYGSGAANSFSSSTIVGYQAGYRITTGSNNTLLGWQAGDALTTGAGNIVIGYDQDASAATASNELNIGGVLYGNLSAKTIGISRAVPEAALDVVSTGTASDVFAQLWRNSAGTIVSSVSATGVMMASKFVGDGSGISGLSGTLNGGQTPRLPYWTGAATLGNSNLSRDSAASLTAMGSTFTVQGGAFSVGGSTLVVKNGNVGIGAANPIHKLDVIGNVRFGLGQGGGNPRGYLANTWTASEHYKFATLGSSYFDGTNWITNESTNYGSNNVSAIGIDIDGVKFYAQGTTGNTQRTDPTATFDGYEKMRISMNGNVGIGTAGPSRTLEVNGEISAARYQINGSTVLALLPGLESIAVGPNAGGSNTGNYNVFVGSGAGAANTNGAQNSFTGNSAGRSNTTGAQNTFLGYSAGFTNSTAWYNTFLGVNAGYYNASGQYNTFVGDGAGLRNTTGADNAILGYYSGYYNQTGSDNFIAGNYAGGYGSGAPNSFSSSTVIGYRAGYNMSGGADKNIFLGSQAGYNVTTGTGNIVIGYNAGTSAPGASNELSIGGLIYGNLAGGNVGIATNAPEGRLDVKAAGTAPTYMAQLWRNSAGTIVSSVSATGVIMASKFVGDGSALSGITATDNTKVLKAGDTMTGALTLPGDPASALQAATKQYVDSWARPCVNPADPNDIMVPVGDLCVDKYEASVWSTAAGGTQYGSASDNYPCNDNGQDCGAAGTKIYARSVTGVTPSKYMTWFQAAAACKNAGKHLLTNAEWQTAAAGTPDPGATGTAPNCNVSGSGPTTTGAGTSCLSSDGVENMIGSLWEWVADWGQYGPNNTTSNGQSFNTAWSEGADYGNDGTWNVGGAAYTSEGGRDVYIAGLPSAVIRGGGWNIVAPAGVFAFNAGFAPSGMDQGIGLRCGRHR